jgi:hypothetical protein
MQRIEIKIACNVQQKLHRLNAPLTLIHAFELNSKFGKTYKKRTYVKPLRVGKDL